MKFIFLHLYFLSLRYKTWLFLYKKKTIDKKWKIKKKKKSLPILILKLLKECWLMILSCLWMAKAYSTRATTCLMSEKFESGLRPDAAINV